MKKSWISTAGPWMVRNLAYLVLLAALFTGGCGRNAPPILPETAKYMPPELQDIYLGMEKAEVDKYFTVQGTQLTNKGLETVTLFVKDSVAIGVAFAYRDGRLITATIWYDYEQVPERVDSGRRRFLKHLIENNGPNYDHCSFVIAEGEFVPDVGLIWKHPGCLVTSTFSKPSYFFPDTISFRPYHQFSIFGAPITPWNLWKNIIIPAEESERPYLREADSLRSLVYPSGVE